jgi:hypothetical protein
VALPPVGVSEFDHVARPLNDTVIFKLEAARLLIFEYANRAYISAFWGGHVEDFYIQLFNNIHGKPGMKPYRV